MAGCFKSVPVHHRDVRSLDVTLRPPAERTPEVFAILADSPALASARLHEWNPGADASLTAFFVCDGDRGPVIEGLEASPLVLDVDASSFGEDRFGLLVRLERGGDPFVERVFEAVTSAGLIVGKPVVYREGRVRARLLGTDETLAAVFERIPDAVAVTVEAIRDLADDPRAGFWALPPRQREALRTAVDLGYFEQPRRATQEDVARALGCSSSTASEHLQKASARLVRAAVVGG